MGSHSRIPHLAAALLILHISLTHGHNPCPVSACGNSRFTVHYPFKFADQTPSNNCTYFDLTCITAHNTTVLSLPNAGDFYVQAIDYIQGYIKLYDPGSCLVRRLMNFSLESSPFRATRYDNYTFYVCPLDSRVWASHVQALACLTNSTDITVATRELSSHLMESYGCTGIGSWPIPDSGQQQFDDDGFFDDYFLFLTWDVTNCKECKQNGRKSGKGGSKQMPKVVAIVSSLPALIILALSCCSVFCLHLMRMLDDKHRADSAGAGASTSIGTPQATVVATLSLPTTTSNTGLDESKITACTKVVVLSETDESISSANANTCSICLDSYCQKDTVWLISKCGHCFHASCIQQWLGKNGTCPVCRTSLSDNAT